jgi:hypothetical protein
MSSNYPPSLDTFPRPSAETLRNAPGGANLSTMVSRLADAMEQVQAKLGIAASTPGGSAAVLRRTASGASAWGQIAAGDYGSGSVATADIAAGAVSGYQSATPTTANPSTSSGSMGDMPQMTIAWTPTVASARVLVVFSATFSHTAVGGRCDFALVLDGVEQLRREVGVVAANSNLTLTIIKVFENLSAALHTVKIQWAVAATAGTMTSGSLNRTLELLEIRR